MRILLALVLILISQGASAAYTYTYTNIIPTIYTDAFPLTFGGEVTYEARERTLAFGILLDNKILPNMSYETTDLLGTSYHDIRDGDFSGAFSYYTSPNFLSTIIFQTDSSGMISEWDISVGAGHFGLSSSKGHDSIVDLGVLFDYEEGETTSVGIWKEQKVKYTFNGNDSYAVSPVPEPESYGMLLVGLGVISLFARRKRS